MSEPAEQEKPLHVRVGLLNDEQREVGAADLQKLYELLGERRQHPEAGK